MIIFNIKTKDAWSQYQAKTNVKGIARIKTAAAGRANRSQLMAVSGLRGRIPAGSRVYARIRSSRRHFAHYVLRALLSLATQKPFPSRSMPAATCLDSAVRCEVSTIIFLVHAKSIQLSIQNSTASATELEITNQAHLKQSI